jgi:type VI secretion system protein VasG
VRGLTDAWTLGSLDFAATRVRTGHVMLALVASDELNRLLREASREFAKITADDLRQKLDAITEGPPRKRAPAARTVGHWRTTAGRRDAEPRPVHGGPHRTRALGQDRPGARPRLRGAADRRHPDATPAEQPDPGRRGGCRQDGGGGGVRRAHRDGDVPPVLRNVTIRTLDLALLQAGAGVKGEFENRLKGLIEEVRSSEIPIILFIDEAHTMIGAGGQAGQGDAANLLKPALARGELRTIAATTWSEYKKYFEKDPALARRFQLVKVEEPTS